MNNLLFKKAKNIFTGGVNSPVRSFSYVGGAPIPIKKGKGSKVYDYNGKEYIDFVLSYGSVILGHSRPFVVKTIQESINDGLGFGALHGSEIELAYIIKKAIPLAENIRFTTSGTEAVMGALRLARAVTGRNKIIKFEGSYHGHADYLLAKTGSGSATLNIGTSSGVPLEYLTNTIVAPAGDADFIKKIFKKNGNNIAAVIIEPVGGNKGVIEHSPGFLRLIKKLTRAHGSLLVFDEVITGFRFRFGSAADRLGIKPDIIVLGKIIGGGLPIGAYAGPVRIMEHLAPLGQTYQASTFAGNPIVMKAGAATLKILFKEKNSYSRVKELAERLSVKTREHALRYGVNYKIKISGSMFSVKLENEDTFGKFYRKLLEKGIYLAPSEYEANFISFSHTERDIDKTIRAIKETFEKIGRTWKCGK